MTVRTDLEQKICLKLQTISANNLQRLAEDIAKIRDPQRYRDLQIIGRNEEGQTTTGWPDAGVIAADGIDAVEATREKDNWQKHIGDDYGKATDGKHKNLTGFLFVAGYPKNRADPNDIGHWTAKFRNLGIDEQRIHVLVGMGLVRELAQPPYARTRLTILGIRDCPAHFKMLGEHTTTNKKSYPFEPTPQEYARGLVHRPRVADAVESKLRERGCALVRGRGAAGKTVLVNLIAAGDDYRSLPTYYLDLAPWAEREEDIHGSVQNELAEFGGKGILFILDNIHRDDDLANDLFHYWKDTASCASTRLLLVGRETRKRFRSLLDDILDLRPLILHAGGDELRGVYRRIVLADYGVKNSEPPEPPEVEVQSWLKTFGGKVKGDNPSADLIAFSAAARRRKNFLLKKEWRLTEFDAIEEIRVHYLAPLSEAEQRNLLRLASLPEDYSLPSPALAAPIASFKNCVPNGIVFESEHGQALHLRYSLVHSALARLLRAAAHPQVDRVEECCAVVRSSPATAMGLARAAWADGDEDLAKQTLQALPTNDWIETQADLGFVITGLKVASTLGVAIFPGGDKIQQTLRDALLTVALRTPLHTLAVFLQYAEPKERGLSAIRHHLIDVLAGQKEKLTELALQSPLEALTFFLQSAEPKRRSLSAVSRDLPYATLEERRLWAIRSDVIDDLARQREELRKLAIRTSLEKLAGFLQYAEPKKRGLSAIRRYLICYLARQREKLTELALRFPLDALTFFLHYAEPKKRGLSDIRGHLIVDLAGHKRELAELAVSAPLDALLSFLETIPFAKDVWDSIDLDAWNRNRENEAPVQPHFIVNLSKMVRGTLGRPELARAPAQIQITKFDPESWRSEVVYIHQFATLIVLAGNVEHDPLSKFLRSTVTQNWLANNYVRAKLGGLAGALFALACHLPSELHQNFDTPDLAARLNREAAAAPLEYAVGWANLLSLFGSAAVLVAMPRLTDPIIWQDHIAAAIAHRPAHDGTGQLRYDTAQFWCGLHDLARQYGDLIAVSSAEGEAILDAWRDAKPPPTPFSKALNAAMIAWLERCQENKWTLTRPNRPIRQEVLDRLRNTRENERPHVTP